MDINVCIPWYTVSKMSSCIQNNIRVGVKTKDFDLKRTGLVLSYL